MSQARCNTSSFPPSSPTFLLRKNLFHHKVWPPERVGSSQFFYFLGISGVSGKDCDHALLSIEEQVTSIIPFQLAGESCSRPNYHPPSPIIINTGHSYPQWEAGSWQATQSGLVRPRLHQPNFHPRKPAVSFSTSLDLLSDRQDTEWTA